MSHEAQPHHTLDCVGLYCPQPLFKTREQLEQLNEGEILEVLADDPAAEEDLKRFAKRAGHELLKSEHLEGGLFRFWIRKKGVKVE